MIAECVPNFSEGRDLALVDRIAAAVPTSMLLDRTSDPDHNRSVLTFAGEPAAVADAAFEAVRAAVAALDLRSHHGVHPRIGVADVVPLVPVAGITMEHCVELARSVGRQIWEELEVPVFFYEAAALRPECVRLENVRRLAMADTLAPDLGTGRHPSAGACVVGARKFLIAWNIDLDTADVNVAKAIAGRIRESGGGLAGVKALGLMLKSSGVAQVSMNLVDFERTPMWVVFAEVERLARELGVGVRGSELIGMLPRAALDACRDRDLKWMNLAAGSVLEARLQCGDAGGTG